MTAKSNSTTRTDIAKILNQLAAARAVFQQRTLLELLTSDQARALAADLDRLGSAPVVARKVREQLG